MTRWPRKPTCSQLRRQPHRLRRKLQPRRLSLAPLSLRPSQPALRAHLLPLPSRPAPQLLRRWHKSSRRRSPQGHPLQIRLRTVRLRLSPKKKAPPPPLNADDTTADPPSQPTVPGASSEADRAPLLAADAPASRVGSVISMTAQAIPRFASCNSGRADGSVAYVRTLSARRRFQIAATAFTLCTAVGTAKEPKAAPAWHSKLPLPVKKNWQHSSWEWNPGSWTPAWGSQGGWQEGWHQGWHQ